MARALSGIAAEEEYFFESFDGTKLFLKEKLPKEGTNKVILLLQGSGGDSRFYDCPIKDYSMMDFLAQEGYDAWALDFRGFGKSGKPDNGRLIKDEVCVKDTLEAINFIKGVRSSNPFLLGNSFGAEIAVATAEMQTEVPGLILIGFLYGKIRSPMNMMMTISIPLMKLFSYLPGFMMPLLLKMLGPGAEKDVGDWASKAFAYPIPVGPLSTIAELPLTHPEKITCPLLVIHGTKDMLADKKDNLSFMEAVASPKKEFLEINEGGHAPYLESPVYKEVLIALKSWL